MVVDDGQRKRVALILLLSLLLFCFFFLLVLLLTIFSLKHLISFAYLILKMLLKCVEIVCCLVVVDFGCCLHPNKL